MRKIQPENLKIMISNLNEAAGDLCELEAWLDYAVNDRMPNGWEGIVRIARRHRRLGIMSFSTPTITVAMLGGSRSGPLRSARLLAV